MHIRLIQRTVLVIALACSYGSLHAASAKETNTLAPEASDAEAALPFWDLPTLDKAFIDATPTDRKDGIVVGKLGVDGGNKDMIVEFSREIADGKHGKFDSLLIAYKGKLLFESYYLRGRVNLPHPQASATKAYTSLALGRAMQLGYMTMADLDKPLPGFFPDLNPINFADGVDKITLNQVLTMRSGIRISDEKRKVFEEDPDQLKGRREIQTYFEQTAPVTAESQSFNYQGDPRFVMHVIDAVAPVSAKDFIKSELLDKMGISNYSWETHASGLPESGWKTSMTSRDMLKWGTLVLNKGKWNGVQLIPEAYIEKATSRLLYTGDDDFHYGGKNTSNQGYGYYWWSADLNYGNKDYFAANAQGGFGQIITVIDELDLLIVHTAHDNDAKYLQIIAERILPAFVQQNQKVSAKSLASETKI